MKKDTKYKYVRKTMTWEGRRYEVTGKTELEALEKLAELKVRLKNGDVVTVKQGVTFGAKTVVEYHWEDTPMSTAAELQALLAADPYPDEAALAALDDRFIAERLSPGGSADLLALTYLLHFFKTEEHLHV